MKRLRKKDHAIENPSYKIFDMMTQDEFKAKEKVMTIFTRDTKNYCLLWRNNECPCLSVLEMEIVNDDNHFQE